MFFPLTTFKVFWFIYLFFHYLFSCSLKIICLDVCLVLGHLSCMIIFKFSGSVVNFGKLTLLSININLRKFTVITVLNISCFFLSLCFSTDIFIMPIYTFCSYPTVFEYFVLILVYLFFSIFVLFTFYVSRILLIRPLTQRCSHQPCPVYK